MRHLARALGVDLEALTGSGRDGRITRDDVHAAAGDAQTTVRTPVRSVRRATAKAVTRSAFTAPHVTEFLTVDATAGVALLERLRAGPAPVPGTPTILALVARAMVLAAQRTPEVNAHWEDGAGGEAVIVRPAGVHLGIATDTDRGLLVPVVRDAHELGLLDLARAITDLAERARAGALTPQDSTGGTLSLTNVGTFGVDSGTPILVPDQSAILALGRLARRPWVLPAGEEHAERVVPRWVLPLALSVDHRVLDGAEASRFLTDVGALLSDPALAMAW